MSSKQLPERESIVGRLVEFMRLHPPFSFMHESDIVHLASHTAVTYMDQGEAVFQPGDPLHDCLYMVRKGSIRIVSQSQELIDQCAEGELFGARAFMESETYQASASVDPEAILIKIPVTELRQLLARDPKVTEFFFGDFSSGLAMRKRKLSDIHTQFHQLRTPEASYSPFEKSHIEAFKTPITCRAELSIKEAAAIMRKNRVGSIIVVSESDHPIGIVTDTDLRDKVVTGLHGIEELISSVMTHPVRTVQPGGSVEEYLMEMIVLGAHHLCVTEKGTSNEPLIGIVTDHDLLVSRGNNAAVLIKELRKSTTREQRHEVVKRFDKHITNLVMHDHPIRDVARIVQGFNRELLRCTIDEILENELPDLPRDSFCWLALGSTARGEQVIRTDFDSAIVFSDSSAIDPARFQALADRVFEELLALGYESDKAGIQANNPTWIRSTTEWKNQFSRWVEVPEEKALLYATIFFDLMPFYGKEALATELQQTIHTVYKGNKRYTAFLAQNALQNPPPLGFFKNLVLEKGGEHGNTFDIKARAMMPLADAARLQALEHNVLFPSNTIERYKRLMDVDEVHRTRYEDCAVAYEIFMRMRAREGLHYQNDGRFIDPTHLAPLEKQVLKNAFEPIAGIQHLIKPA